MKLLWLNRFSVVNRSRQSKYLLKQTKPVFINSGSQQLPPAPSNELLFVKFDPSKYPQFDTHINLLPLQHQLWTQIGKMRLQISNVHQLCRQISLLSLCYNHPQAKFLYVSLQQKSIEFLSQFSPTNIKYLWTLMLVHTFSVQNISKIKQFESNFYKQNKRNLNIAHYMEALIKLYYLKGIIINLEDKIKNQEYGPTIKDTFRNFLGLKAPTHKFQPLITSLKKWEMLDCFDQKFTQIYLSLKWDLNHEESQKWVASFLRLLEGKQLDYLIKCYLPNKNKRQLNTEALKLMEVAFVELIPQKFMFQELKVTKTKMVNHFFDCLSEVEISSDFLEKYRNIILDYNFVQQLVYRICNRYNDQEYLERMTLHYRGYKTIRQLLVRCLLQFLSNMKFLNVVTNIGFINPGFFCVPMEDLGMINYMMTVYKLNSRYLQSNLILQFTYKQACKLPLNFTTRIRMLTLFRDYIVFLKHLPENAYTLLEKFNDLTIIEKVYLLNDYYSQNGMIEKFIKIIVSNIKKEIQNKQDLHNQIAVAASQVLRLGNYSLKGLETVDKKYLLKLTSLINEYTSDTARQNLLKILTQRLDKTYTMSELESIIAKFQVKNSDNLLIKISQLMLTFITKQHRSLQLFIRTNVKPPLKYYKGVENMDFRGNIIALDKVLSFINNFGITVIEIKWPDTLVATAINQNNYATIRQLFKYMILCKKSIDNKLRAKMIEMLDPRKFENLDESSIIAGMLISSEFRDSNIVKNRLSREEPFPELDSLLRNLKVSFEKNVEVNGYLSIHYRITHDGKPFILQVMRNRDSAYSLAINRREAKGLFKMKLRLLQIYFPDVVIKVIDKAQFSSLATTTKKFEYLSLKINSIS